MNADGIDVFNEAHRDHLAFAVANDFQLKLFPAFQRLFDEHFMDQTRLQAAGRDRPQLLQIVAEATARAAHRVGGADDHREADLLRDALRVFNGMDRFALRHVDAQRIHRLLEGETVFAAFDGVQLHADHLYIIFIKDAFERQFAGEIQGRLAAEIRQQRVRPFLFDDLLHALRVQRLDIRRVRHARIRHDGGRIGVHENDFIAQTSKSLAGLSPAVVKFTSLSDDDRSGAYDHHFFDVFAFRHECSSR